MTPTLVIVTGMPGSGKSTIARRLGDAIRLPVLDRDDLKDTMFDVLGWKDRAWSEQVGAASWELMFLLIDRMLSGGASLIAETNFSPRERPRLQEIRARVPSTWAEVYCYATPEICAERMANRLASGDRHPGHNPGATQPADYLVLLRSRTWEPIGLADVTYRIDTTTEPTPDLAEIAAKIDLLERTD